MLIVAVVVAVFSVSFCIEKDQKVNERAEKKTCTDLHLHCGVIRNQNGNSPIRAVGFCGEFLYYYRYCWCINKLHFLLKSESISPCVYIA